MKTIATIGYEGASPEAFDAALESAGVSIVVDIRAVAVSRRRGFSKTALSERLRASGFEYIHLRGLGDPKPGRDAARAGKFSEFREIFSTHLRSIEAALDLEVLRALAATQRVALLCYEAEATNCHRAIVADRIANSSELSILHLRVEQGRAATSGQSRAHNHSREGLAAA